MAEDVGATEVSRSENFRRSAMEGDAFSHPDAASFGLFPAQA
jgi:hypothetical protein